MEKTNYTYGPEEANEVANHLHELGKELFSHKYADMRMAIEIMRKYREKKGLGHKVIIKLRDDVKMRRNDGMRKTYRIAHCPFKGFIFGRFQGMNPVTKEPRWAIVPLMSFRELDLRRDEDAADWLVLRLSPHIYGSFNAQRLEKDDCYWEIIDERQQMKDSINRMALYGQIYNVIKAMPAKESLNLARAMGYTVLPGDESVVDSVEIKGYLTKKAFDDPEEWKKEYQSANRKYKQLLYTAFNLNIATNNNGSEINVMGNIIGNSIEEAISYLRHDSNLTELLINKIEEEDFAAANLEKNDPTPKTAVKSNEDLSKNILESELAPEPPASVKDNAKKDKGTKIMKGSLE